jgi:hypothetical protein
MELNVVLTYSEHSDITLHAEIAESDSPCSCTFIYFFMIHFNLLKSKRNMLYIRNQSVPRSKHSIMVIKASQLMMYKAKVAVCSDIRTKHSTQSEHLLVFLNVKPGGT